MQERHGSSGHALVLNLGPAWSNEEAYELFLNNVIEIPFKDWESPPGLAVCPLDIIFTVCSSIASWLATNDDHSVVRLAPPLTEHGSSLPYALPATENCTVIKAMSIFLLHGWDNSNEHKLCLCPSCASSRLMS